MTLLTVLSPLSAWLVMLALSAQSCRHGQPQGAHFLTPRHLLLAYALPLLGILALPLLLPLSREALLGLMICVLSGCGTSGAAIARAAGAAPDRIIALMVASAAIAVLGLPLAVLLQTDGSHFMTSAVTILATLLLAQWLPFQLGRRYFLRHREQERLERALDKLASLSVIALILLIAWQELPRLPEHPAIAIAGALTAVMLGVVSRAATAPARGLETLIVVRNLTAATLVVTRLPMAAEAMTALCAFGLAMYPVALTMTWLARTPRAGQSPL